MLIVDKKMSPNVKASWSLLTPGPCIEAGRSQLAVWWNKYFTGNDTRVSSPPVVGGRDFPV